jgi:hypothetical protein
MFSDQQREQIGGWLRSQTAVVLHTLLYLIVVVANVTTIDSPVINVILIGWTLLLILHGLQLDAFRARGYIKKEKPKHHRLELGDDGELVELDEADEKPKRKGQG